MNDETEEQRIARQIDKWHMVMIPPIGLGAILIPDEEMKIIRNRFQVHLEEIDK